MHSEARAHEKWKIEITGTKKIRNPTVLYPTHLKQKVENEISTQFKFLLQQHGLGIVTCFLQNYF
jgi:hypothetical protein